MSDQAVSTNASTLTRQRYALAKVFLMNGFLLGCFVPHIPFLRDKHDLSEGALGLALLFVAFGAVAGMIATGPASARFGPHVVVRWTTMILAVALPLVMIAPSAPTLVAALALFGAALGSMDVSMNAIAADIENRFERPIMSSFHALFSVGGLLGALIAAGLLWLDIQPAVQSASIGVMTALLILPSLSLLPPPLHAPVAGSTRFKFPRGRLLALGAMAFVFFMCEGAVGDWSATLLRDELGSSSAVAALGYGAFSITMAVGRFTGDRINERVGAVTLLRTGGAVAAAGLAVGLLVGTTASVIIAFALMGFGLANIVPLLFTAAAKAGRTPAEGIGSVAALGYAGLLLGPPLIGALAEFTSLTVGLGSVAVLAAIASSRASRVLTPLSAPASE